MSVAVKFQFLSVCLVALVWAGSGNSVRAQSAESLARKGNELYKHGDYQAAVDAYRQALVRKPDDDLIKYNLGTALAKAGQTADAQKTLNEAAEIPHAPRRRDSYYNAGVAVGEAAQKKPEDDDSNASAAPGAPVPSPAQAQQAEANSLQQRISMLEQSLASFRKAILTDSKDNYAKYNYETVMDQLRLLRQQQQQMKQKQQQGKNQQDQQEGQGQQSQDQQDQQGNDKNNQGKNPKGQKSPQKQQQKKGGNKSRQQKSGGNAQADDQNSDSGDNQGQQLTPEQRDALGLLNLLEAEKPEQFKQLFRDRGGDPSKHPQRNW